MLASLSSIRPTRSYDPGRRMFRSSRLRRFRRLDCKYHARLSVTILRTSGDRGAGSLCLLGLDLPASIHVSQRNRRSVYTTIPTASRRSSSLLGGQVAHQVTVRSPVGEMERQTAPSIGIERRARFMREDRMCSSPQQPIYPKAYCSLPPFPQAGYLGLTECL
jgi:hypothetical protein